MMSRLFAPRFVLARLLPGALLALLAAAPAWALDVNPEAASGYQAKTLATARQYMIATANPLASQAGEAVLARGGSAVDAVIAAQLVLNLTEPQSSGIGGGAFMLHYDAATHELVAYDSRETAPAAARPDRFLRDGKPIPFAEAVNNGRAVATPGLLRGLALAHADQAGCPGRICSRRPSRWPSRGSPSRRGCMPSSRRARNWPPSPPRRVISWTARASPGRWGMCCAIPSSRVCCGVSPRKARTPSTRARSRAISWRRCGPIPSPAT